jgi:FkbM family methyltransferase
VVDSVSKAFYEHGWRGVHIEPVPQYAELLRQDRPDEIVLQIALSDSEGTLELNVIPDTGLSTAVEAYAQRHQTERGFNHQRIQVPVLTLKSALQSLAGKEVHWLKIDAEGFEEEVLKGWDSKILRPWVMVVEATIPNSPETNFARWEPILTAADYQFVYFDGLNRFYVAKEHSELAGAFSSPPNVFDGVQLSGLASSELCRGLIASYQEKDKELAIRAEMLAVELNLANEHSTQVQADSQWLQNEWDAVKQRVEELSRCTGRLGFELDAERQRTVQLGVELQSRQEHESHLQAHAQWLQNEWDAAKAKVDELNQSSHHWWTVADGLNRELQCVYVSKSWKITAPLRKTMLAAKWVSALPARTARWSLRLPKRVTKPLLVWIMRKTITNPRLKVRAMGVLAKHPQLRQHLRQFAIRSGLAAGWGVASPIIQPAVPNNTVRTAHPLIMPTELPTRMPPRAARIYADLQKAIEVRKN